MSDALNYPDSGDRKVHR